MTDYKNDTVCYTVSQRQCTTVSRKMCSGPPVIFFLSDELSDDDPCCEDSRQKGSDPDPFKRSCHKMHVNFDILGQAEVEIGAPFHQIVKLHKVDGEAPLNNLIQSYNYTNDDIKMILYHNKMILNYNVT